MVYKHCVKEMAYIKKVLKVAKQFSMTIEPIFSVFKMKVTVVFLK